MKLLLIFIFSILSGFSSSAQLYFAKKGWTFYYAEITGDSARVEVFSSYRYFTHLESDEYIKLENEETKSLSAEKQNRLIKSNEKVNLLHKIRNKYDKAKLKPIEVDNRDHFRKEAYSTRKANEVHKFGDSLSVENRFSYYALHFSLEKLPLNEYIHEVDRKVDSAKTSIIQSKDSLVTYYYNMADNLEEIDPAQAFDLLSKADYKKAYGKYLIREMAMKKPALLIQYINKKPINRKPILRTIRQHDKFKEIVSQVKAEPGKSKGKRLLVKQKFNRHLSDAGAISLAVSVVAVELAIIPLVIIWIF